MVHPRTSGVILLGAALVVVLAGCSSGPAPDDDPTATATKTATAPSTPVAAPTTGAPSAEPSSTPTCGPADGATAAARGIAALPAPTQLPDVTWDASTADYTGYDPCAALSWSTVTVGLATASSPVAVLLFHDGTYLGTATKEAYAFVPDITRTAPDAIEITYHYPQGNDANADPTGRAVADLRWDDADGRVAFSGSTPPSM
jgi:hypothetical protein